MSIEFSLLQQRIGTLWRWRRGRATLRADRLGAFRARLRDEKLALEAFTALMEEEFLHLGGLLRQITALAREVRSRSGEIVNAAAGQAEDAAIQFAFQLLKKAEDLVHASRDQYESVLQVFQKMHGDLTRVARERSALTRTLSPLQTTNTQFRIQACSFDGNTRAQFFELADAIAAIVRDVQSAVGQRFEELDRTGQATGELAGKLAVWAAEQRGATERMLAETREHLARLHEALVASERAAQHMADAGANIAGGVGQAIVALQCQDMARQKFQHIAAAIDEMNGHLEPDASGWTSAQETDCRHFLADAGRVQMGQLRAVFEQLAGAARQVSEGLAGIESESKCLVGHAVRSGGAALDGQIIQRAIESIHAVLGVIGNAVSGITGVVELVAKLKSTFSDCTTQILGLALRLRMVALNAQVFAAHVDAGAALEVVAHNTRVIADESMLQLDEISLRVNQLVDSVVDLEQRLADYSEVASGEQKLLTDEARASEKKLGLLERELRDAMAAIGPLEKELAATVQRAIQSIRFPAAVAEAAGRSTALFEQIAGLYAEGTSDAHHKVQSLRRNYTMAHERAVHECVVGVASLSGSIDGDTARLEAGLPEGGGVLETRDSPFEDGPGEEMAREQLPGEQLTAPEIPPAEAEEEQLADNVELF